MTYSGRSLTAVEVTDALGQTTRTTYDEAGRKLTETLALGTAAEATTAYEYDERGNLIALTDPVGNETTWTYNLKNQEIAMTDPLGNLDPENAEEHTVYKVRFRGPAGVDQEPQQPAAHLRV